MAAPNRFSMFLDYVRPPPKIRHRIEQIVVDHIITPKHDEDTQTYSRVREWFNAQLSGRPITPTSPLQQGCHDVIPNVRAKPVWDLSDIPSLQTLITPQLMSDVREEFCALRTQGGQFQTYRNPIGASRGAVKDPSGFGELAHDKGNWSVAYLTLHDMTFPNTTVCPKTMSFLKTVPRLFDHALFSVLGPNSHIIAHCGPTNKKIRIHLPLVVPPNNTATTEHTAPCRLRVGETTLDVQEGKPLLFDDSFVHEAWNDSNIPRSVLLFDIWHPDLSDGEVEFLRLVQNAFEHHLQRQAEKDVREKVPNQMMNPYGIILAAKERPPPDANVLWE